MLPHENAGENAIFSASASRNASTELREDAELAELVSSWEALPEALKAGILAMVRDARGEVPR